MKYRLSPQHFQNELKDAGHCAEPHPEWAEMFCMLQDGHAELYHEGSLREGPALMWAPAEWTP